MHVILLILTAISLLSPKAMSQIYGHSLDSIKWLADDFQKIERINEALTRNIARNFQLIPDQEFAGILALRQEICAKNLDGCFTLKPWMSWSCLKNGSDNSEEIVMLWKSVVGSLPEEKAAGDLLKAINGCAKSHSDIKTQAQFQLFLKSNQQSWMSIKRTSLDSLLAHFPLEADESRIEQFADFIWQAYRIEGIDFSDLIRMADFGGKILKVNTSDLTDVKLNLANAVVFIWDRASTSEEEKVVSLVEKSIQTAWQQKNPAPYALDWAVKYCYALKKLGRHEECEALFNTYFKNSQDLKVAMAKHTIAFDSGQTEAGLKGITELSETSVKLKSSEVPWIFLRKGFMEASAGKLTEAESSLKRYHDSLSQSLGILDAIYADILKVIILRDQGKYGEAEKMIKTLRPKVERRAKGKFFARLYLEYHSLLLALHSGKLSEAENSAKRIETLLPNTYYDLALRAYQNAKKGKSPSAEYAKIESLFGEKFPLLEELKAALKKLSPPTES